MRTLVSLFEGILDTDYDISDNAIFADIMKDATGYRYEHEMPELTTDGEWLVFDCAKCNNDIYIRNVNPFKKAGYSKYRFINCTDVDIDIYENTLEDIEIDAPNAKVQFSDNNVVFNIINVKLNAKSLYIDAYDSDNMKVIMKGCKFDVAYIKFQAITQLSIADTCKFTNCKILYLGRVGKSVARKANELLLCDVRNGVSFERQVESFEPNDETLYWDIDVMKTLSLKPNKWPDLGKIVIVPNGIPSFSAPGICLYKIGKTMLPISSSPNGKTVEFKGGWKGRHVRRAKTELNCVTK